MSISRRLRDELAKKKGKVSFATEELNKLKIDLKSRYNYNMDYTTQRIEKAMVDDQDHKDNIDDLQDDEVSSGSKRIKNRQDPTKRENKQSRNMERHRESPS